MLETLQRIIAKYHYLVLPVIIVISFLLYRIFRFVLGRIAYFIVLRTKTVYDNLIVDRLHPFRIAWMVPLLLFYVTSDVVFQQTPYIKNVLLFLMIWILVDFLIALLNGLNDVYKHRPDYSGVSVSAYADLVKVLLIVVAIVLSISIFVKVSPLVLFSGVGAWLAVLMLIFKDTILSFLANIQISSQERIKDGDWIEVPSYQADGIVTDINLYSIKVQNWDKTFTVIPTFKMDEVAYKNWRGMIEEKGRRFIKSLVLDITSIKCCDISLVEKLSSSPIVADLLKDILPELQERLSQKAAADGSTSESSLVTNLQLFIQYTEAYLQGRDDLQQRKRFLKFVTIKEITPAGLSIEILWFTKATGKAQYEATQTDVMLHLIAILALFDLRMYQHPSGLDLKTYVKERLGD